jgi:hypothetical protein
MEEETRTHTRKWYNNIKIDVRKISWEDVNWIHLAQQSPIAWVCEHY